MTDLDRRLPSSASGRLSAESKLPSYPILHLPSNLRYTCWSVTVLMSKETTTTLAPPSPSNASLLTDQDLHLFNEGTHYRIYNKLGAHIMTSVGGKPGTMFGVWAPNARSVSVVGDFNGWDPLSHPLLPHGSSGIWDGFIPG